MLVLFGIVKVERSVIRVCLWLLFGDTKSCYISLSEVIYAGYPSFCHYHGDKEVRIRPK